MFNLPEELQQQNWFVIDQSVTGLQMNPMASFAMDDTLCEIVASKESTGFARSWVHDKTVVLGIQDSRLPQINEGISYLEKQGYQVIVRNSGGLAVVLDEDVYNLSLLFPETRALTIDLGYEAMVAFTRELLPELGDLIQDGEISTSYCPGRFDLSVNGQKFAGISQRRIRGGIAVQIYLAMQGSGAARAELIRSFYNIAAAGGDVKYSYPQIVPETMASLTELIGTPLTNEALTHRIFLALEKHSDSLAEYELSETEQERFQYHLERMFKRNERLR
ncbi:lipoate--protein ligase family protein [Alkalicoccus daliensis]|uniref:Octanoyl-[GcvH]:protein N-octanoyltransferase n=1 Tax=Alkalicoccus daliensis TaxID=745820 RepID=A0A1H0L1Y4_9BACI|nr:biotin/lipoate A/B protein ligase family protein [Alkalicoccus daliensis]SDO62304.1 octanoyl-[GcvH]:protein N-octanoyltransferase [Alkalicoccus daliensis]